MALTTLREKAITLRQKGLSYAEILKEVPVAKSTLSLWLYSIGLSKKQKQRLTEKKIAGALRGAQVKKRKRILRVKQIYEDAQKEVASLSHRELWLIGIALYWAEGSKEKEGQPGSGVQFTNSDAWMVKVFLKWLIDICRVSKKEIYFDLFVRETSKDRIRSIIVYWSQHTKFPEKCFQHIYFKRNKTATNRKNIGASYFGVIKVRVRKSSTLNRKIAGWTKGVIEFLR